jgi:SAM-dependent methyltransferase
MTGVATAAQRWHDDLLQWGIPPEIEARAERSPWGHPPDRFAMRADAALRDPEGASFDRAREALEELTSYGTLLDVGSGVGAASLPLLPYASALTAVDPSEEMLTMLTGRAATSSSVPVATVTGRWPDVAGSVEVHDVVVCHHVVSDIPNLGPFLAALTDHARLRVVIELPPQHPQAWLAPLWLRFHGVLRPTRPVADDLVEVLRELGVGDVVVDRWVRPDPGLPVDIALITRRLCLPESMEPEVAAAWQDLTPASFDTVTLSWPTHHS